MTYQQQIADAATAAKTITTDAAASSGLLFYSVSAETALADAVADADAAAATTATMTADAVLAATAVNS